jgi:hypothetical protein
MMMVMMMIANGKHLQCGSLLGSGVDEYLY